MIKKILFIVVSVVCTVASLFSRYGWRFQKVSVSVYAKDQPVIAANLEKHVRVLSDRIGWRHIEQYENLQQAASYIVEQFTALGLDVTRQKVVADKKVAYNIIAEKKGSTKPEDVVIVGAHYDSYFNPGADSNASGVAALLELARLASAHPRSATVRFVAFTNTEAPFFATEQMGSVVYARYLCEQQEQIAAVIILDSLGYYSDVAHSQRYPVPWGIWSPNKGNFVLLVGKMASWGLTKQIQDVMAASVPLAIEATVGYDFISSDHWAFWKQRHKAVLVTDTGPYRNQAYHSLADTAGRLNYGNMAQVVYGLDKVLDALAR